MNKALVLCAALFAAACGQTQSPAPTAPQEAAATLELRDAWAAPTPGGVDVSAGYLTIANGTSAEDHLITASSARAERVEIHEMTMDEAGVMRMRAVNSLAVPSGEEINLGPGGLHLMFFGVTQPFALGEEIPVTLTFANAGAIDVVLPVRAGATHGGGGH